MFNEEKYLDELLDSVVAQTLHNVEIIVTDNASTDTTWDIIEKFRKQDHRISSVRYS